MNLKIRNVTLNYDTDNVVEFVNVGFDSNEEGVNIYGNIKITKAEYDSNQDVTALQTLITTKVRENVNAV